MAKNFKSIFKNGTGIDAPPGRIVINTACISLSLVILLTGIFVGTGAPIPLLLQEPEDPTAGWTWEQVGEVGPVPIIPPPPPPPEPPPEPPEEPPYPVEEIDVHVFTLELAELINYYRSMVDKPPLILDHPGLGYAAMRRAQEISEVFAHIRPDGTSVWTIYPAFNAAAENIARGHTDPKAIMNSWMVSPTHRRNVFDYQDYGYDALGVGLYIAEDGTFFWAVSFIRIRHPEEGLPWEDYEYGYEHWYEEWYEYWYGEE